MTTFIGRPVSRVDGRQKVTDFFAERDFARLEPYLDPDMAIMTALRVDTLPTTILYDSDGVEVWRITGMAEWGDARTTRLVKAVRTIVVPVVNPDGYNLTREASVDLRVTGTADEPLQPVFEGTLIDSELNNSPDAVSLLVAPLFHVAGLGRLHVGRQAQ